MSKLTDIIEINTDSPAMMTFADEVEAIQRALFPWHGLDKEFAVEGDNRTAVLLDAILECYRAQGGASKAPTIAIE